MASLSSDGVGSDVVTLIESWEGEEAEAAALVAVVGCVDGVADDGEQQANEQEAVGGPAATVAVVGTVVVAVAVTGALIHDADVTGMGVEYEKEGDGMTTAVVGMDEAVGGYGSGYSRR